jgi:SAM-dependent methyltransferase
MKDVPSPINLQDDNDARAWAEKAIVLRPYRTRFFEIMAGKIVSTGMSLPRVLELGSGPGFLIEHVLKSGTKTDYEALDFSEAMHNLARERLGWLADGIRFHLADFKKNNWQAGLGRFDFVLTMQAVHELRHKEYAPGLFAAVRELLGEGGVFLYCDHHCGEGGIDNAGLYMTPQEQEATLLQCFENATMLHAEGSLILWESRRLG